MGLDDGRCERSLDGEHLWVLGRLLATDRGMEQELTCACGAVSFQPSATNEPNRPPL